MTTGETYTRKSIDAMLQNVADTANDAKKIAKEADKKADENSQKIAKIETTQNNFDTTVKQAIENAILTVHRELAIEYKENNKWKDRTIIGFLITLFMFILGVVVSILRGG
ncbi:hypothetical protein [Culicoidibacter larvae]|uniref:Uncharacterized protein n=1 Tax=Culicoidibacter larvae TaxID=2579976 RepID=A0A5R8Q8L4_9FIRM|nr:hypothetical protein [Culicoidibacter larvae]TLG72041.1 hypothetical protein FEZ08_09415 [Culicoidibacter larvae]